MRLEFDSIPTVQFKKYIYMISYRYLEKLKKNTEIFLKNLDDTDNFIGTKYLYDYIY